MIDAADLESRARILSNRALAWEGAGRWDDALGDYDAALAAANDAGLPPDPYVLNSRGNCLASLGEYERRGRVLSWRAFGDAGGVNTARNNGSGGRVRVRGVQRGVDPGAARGRRRRQTEMEKVSGTRSGKRGHARGLAAIYWSEGRGEDAERSGVRVRSRQRRVFEIQVRSG